MPNEDIPPAVKAMSVEEREQALQELAHGLQSGDPRALEIFFPDAGTAGAKDAVQETGPGTSLEEKQNTGRSWFHRLFSRR